ncbi:Glycosylphosphatidylinositol (GPI) anchor assembly protein [Naganishia albida]|nr:Glycosylphosphatidylinositol (GPI) anchor assembly protein [Naganishia albida]
MPNPEPAFARRWRTKFNAALHRTTAKTTASTSTGYYFPLAQYLSLHLVLSIFLTFSLGFLPRSQAWLDSVLPSSWAAGRKTAGMKQVISADRPEHELLTPLTANATVTLAWTCAGLVVCMTWWGAHLRRWWTTFRESEGGSAKQDDTILAAQKALLATLVGAAVIYPFLVLLGAPLSSHMARTALLALHLSLLLILPPTYALGIPSLYESGTFERYRLTRLFCELSPETQLERATVYPVVGTVLGAWCGVIPLAFDWDRPWQTYPLPPAATSILGFILGGLASFLHSIFLEAVDASKAVVAAQAEERQEREEKVKRKKKKGGKAL